jgi:hypothetical protein
MLFLGPICHVSLLAQEKCFMLSCFLVAISCEGYPMKRKLVFAALLLLFLQSGCYVSTNLKVKNRQLPADFSAPVLVITLQEKTNLGSEYLTPLEQGFLQVLNEKGVNSVTLSQALDKSDQDRATTLLLQNDYRAFLRVVIDSWGSRSEVLPDRIPPSVESIQTDRDSTFYPPGAIDGGGQQPGPTSSYKEVAMSAYLTDLRTNRIVWSGRVNARPAVVGRSCLYHRFNRSLEYDELAGRCFRKIAQELSRMWPKESEK